MPSLEERVKRLETGAFWILLGMKVNEAKDGRATVTMPIKPDLLQLYGVVHVGALASLVDGAIGAAVQSSLQEDEASTTVDLQVMYDKAAEQGLLTAKSSIIRRGRTIIFAECQVHDDEGVLIAHGTATYMVLEHKRWNKALN